MTVFHDGPFIERTEKDPTPQAAYMVKQYVAVVQGRWCKFMVFETGSPKHYLFSQLDPSGCATTLQFPVLKTDLRDDIRRALAHGWGNAGL
jgi:hypothetical protein